jgi:hypothetical protein
MLINGLYLPKIAREKIPMMIEKHNSEKDFFDDVLFNVT